MALVRPFIVSSEVTREDAQSLTCSRLLLENFITSNLNCISPKVNTERVTNQDQKQRQANKQENQTKPDQTKPKRSRGNSFYITHVIKDEQRTK